MKVHVKMDKEWNRMRKALQNSRSRAKVHLKRATMYIGKKGEALVRQEFSAGGYAANAELTVALKGGKNEPLRGDRTGAPMFKAITSTVVDDYTVFVGILQQDDQYNIALAVHEGANVPVTQKMRNMFNMLYEASEGASVKLEGRAKELFEKHKNWLPLKDNTKFINIPSRPFIKKAMSKGEIQAAAKKMWNQAMIVAIREASK